MNARGITYLLAAICTGTLAGNDVSISRSMEVEKISETTYRVECRVQYKNVDPNAEYEISVYGSGTDMPWATYPYGGRVSPGIPKVEFTDDSGGHFEASLKSGTLTAKRSFTHSQETLPSYPTDNRICQGGARNMTTGIDLRGFILTDQRWR